MVYIGVKPNRTLVLHRFNGYSFKLSGYIDHIDIGSGGSAVNSALGYMKYKPNYPDYHNSGLASIFLQFGVSLPLC